MRYVNTELERPRWRATANYRVIPTLQLGVEYNLVVAELSPLATLFLLTETERRPALFLFDHPYVPLRESQLLGVGRGVERAVRSQCGAGRRLFPAADVRRESDTLARNLRELALQPLRRLGMARGRGRRGIGRILKGTR